MRERSQAVSLRQALRYTGSLCYSVDMPHMMSLRFVTAGSRSMNHLLVRRSGQIRVTIGLHDQADTDLDRKRRTNHFQIGIVRLPWGHCAYVRDESAMLYT